MMSSTKAKPAKKLTLANKAMLKKKAAKMTKEKSSVKNEAKFEDKGKDEEMGNRPNEDSDDVIVEDYDSDGNDGEYNSNSSANAPLSLLKSPQKIASITETGYIQDIVKEKSLSSVRPGRRGAVMTMVVTKKTRIRKMCGPIKRRNQRSRMRMRVRMRMRTRRRRRRRLGRLPNHQKGGRR